MHRFFTLIVVIAMLANAGCGEQTEKGKTKNSDNNNELFSQVMNIHDEAMARMGELHHVKKELKESLKSVDTTSRIHDSLSTLIKELELADEGMFDWMGKFKDPRESLSSQDAQGYLEDQLTKVKKVSLDIDKGISAGKNILTKIRTDHE